MKIRLATSLFAATLTVAGCAPGLLGADVSRELPEQTIPGDPVAHAAAAGLLQVGMGTAPVIELESANPAVDTTGLNQILLRALTMDITSTAEPPGDADCWDFVLNTNVYIESTRQGSVLPRMKIASGGAPGCVRSMVLTPVADVNLKPYTDQGFRVVAEAAGVPPEDAVSFVTHLGLRAAVF